VLPVYSGLKREIFVIWYHRQLLTNRLSYRSQVNRVSLALFLGKKARPIIEAVAWYHIAEEAYFSQ
jgi:hypothetical protein